MSHEIFTDSWARAWGEELRASEAYRRAAATWEGSLLLELAADAGQGVPAERVVYVDLWHGECRLARVATAGDQEGADFVLRAGLDSWRRVLSAGLDPIFGIMSGQLKLRRGSLARLTPYLTASKELVQAAARVDSTFPSA